MRECVSNIAMFVCVGVLVCVSVRTAAECECVESIAYYFHTSRAYISIDSRDKRMRGGG